MKQRFINALIVAISAALLGLISVQIYWVNNAVTLRENQFEQDVMTALNNVVHQLERHEAIERVKQHDLGNALFLTMDSLNMQRQQMIIDTTYEDYQVKIIERSDVDSFGVPTPIAKIITKKYGEPAQVDVDLNFNEQEELYAQELLAFFESDEYSEEERIFQKTSFINDIVTSLLSTNVFQKINDRVTLPGLDSLLKEKLLEQGIKARYKFAVFDVFDQPVVYNEEGLSETLESMEGGYKVGLFPNDIVREPNYLNVVFPNQKRYVLSQMWAILLSSVVLIIAIICAFAYTILTIVRQKKLSEIKNDFINNMTHELKTPIATISLACEALGDADVEKNVSTMNNFVGMIRDENKRLGVLVENVLQSAVIDRGELKLKRDPIDVHQIIQRAVKNIELQIRKKQGYIEMALNAATPMVVADRVHVTNVIFNLLDNANKYTNDKPKITITTTNKKQGVVISVQDNGIGISKENQKKIFDKLYRVPTGNVHNVKGFGLGLSYVKAIVEKHGGSITIDSEQGKGSTFNIYLPHEYEEQD